MLLEEAFPDQWQGLMETKRSILHYANPEFCGKWKILKKLLRFWHDNGDKVLVFSHSVRLLKMLQMLFKSTAYNVSYLDGSMALEDRATEVDIFNSDPDQFVFLISTKAGGVGLNITSANKVVIFDQSDNPQDDVQAENRAHRLGQTRDVEIVRLLSSSTVEGLIHEACRKKLELAKKVTGSTAGDVDDGGENMETRVRKMMKEQLTPP